MIFSKLNTSHSSFGAHPEHKIRPVAQKPHPTNDGGGNKLLRDGMGKVFKTFATLAASLALSPSLLLFLLKLRGAPRSISEIGKPQQKERGANITIGRDNSALNTRLLSHFKQGWS